MTTTSGDPINDTDASGVADPSELQEALEILIGAVDGLTREAEAGRPVSCAGLDQQVDKLCKTSLTLPPGMGRPLAPRFAALIDGLDRLAEALQHQAHTNGAPPRAQDQPTVRQQAIRAYAKPPPIDPGKP